MLFWEIYYKIVYTHAHITKSNLFIFLVIKRSEKNSAVKEVESIFLCERATFFFRVRLRPLHLHSNYLYILICYIIFEYVSDDPCLRFSEISTPTVAAPYAFSNAVGFFNISLLHNNTCSRIVAIRHVFANFL